MIRYSQFVEQHFSHLQASEWISPPSSPFSLFSSRFIHGFYMNSGFEKIVELVVDFVRDLFRRIVTAR